MTMMYMTFVPSPSPWTWSKLLGSNLKAAKDILLFCNQTVPSGHIKKCSVFVSSIGFSSSQIGTKNFLETILVSYAD